MLATCNYLHTYKKLYLRSIKSTMWMCFSKIIAIAGIKILVIYYFVIIQNKIIERRSS